MGKLPNSGRDLKIAVITFDILLFFNRRKSPSILGKSHGPKGDDC